MTPRARSSYFEVARPRVEVIPMIDIMMFLLVFFVLIAVRMIAGTGIPLDLPGSKSTQELKASTVTIGVTKTGDTVIDGDKDVSLQTLMKVMDTVRSAGITTVGLAAKAEKR
jgi:biopolymer transport protein ExbD